MENCIKYQERISAFIDGLLTDEERLELMEHMAHCSDCQQYFDDQIAIHDALTGLEADAPAGFVEAVMARVRETKQDVHEKKVITFPHWRRWAAAAACCAIAVLGAMSLGGRDGMAPSISQNIVAYDMPRSQTETTVSDDTAAADNKAVTYTTQSSANTVQTDSAPAEDVAPCALKDSDAPAAAPSAPESARTEDAKAMDAAADSRVMTTASPLAKQWVTDTLGPDAAGVKEHHLTEEQFSQLRELLEDAGEAFSYAESPSDRGPCWLLVLAEP